MLMLLHREEVTVANGKQIMMQIIDGDQRMPGEIAEDLGLSRSVNINQEVQDAVDLVIQENPDVVKKIQEGNLRRVNNLMGLAMKMVNRRGDPVVIKTLITQAIANKGGNQKATQNSTSEEKKE